MSTYPYHHVITPPNYMVPSDPYQMQQHNHFAAVVAAAASNSVHSQVIPQMNRSMQQQQASALPSISQTNLPYPSPYAPPAPLARNYSYSQPAPINPYIPQQQQQQQLAPPPQQPPQLPPPQQQQQAQRLPSLTQASRHSSYDGLSDMSSYQYNNSYQLPYPKKSISSSSSANFSQSQVGSYSLNGTTFYVPSVNSVPYDHGDFITRSQQYSYQQKQQQQNYSQQQQQHFSNNSANSNPNEGVVTGGVAAKLDYNLEEMSQFIAIKALEIMTRYTFKANLSTKSFVDAFTKFTFQVLTATRLPKSTLILALVYLSERWSRGAIPETQSPIHEVYKMLVVALLLANKFHDDNTFTNKSWHEATGVPVSDLRIIEADWLRAIKWNLNLKNTDGWNDCHKEYNNWISKRRDSVPVSVASYSPSYPTPSRSSYPISPASSPESRAMSNEKARSLYSSPPSFSYPYSKWYPNGNNANTNNSYSNVAPPPPPGTLPSSVSSSSLASTMSRSSSISTLATPPSTRGLSYNSYYNTASSQHSYGGATESMYHRHHPVSSYYTTDYAGGMNCNCSNCNTDVSKMPWGGYSYAVAC